MEAIELLKEEEFKIEEHARECKETGRNVIIMLILIVNQ